jgi:GNAT superfamily N-acetyltransferase
VSAIGAEAAVDGWWARVPADGHPGPSGSGALLWVVSGEFPADTVVSLPGGRRPPAWRVAVTFAGSSDRASRIEVAVPAAPLLWYVQHVEAAATPPATTLIAFSDARHPEGTVLSGEEALASGVTGEHQVAACRWWTGSGLVHQIYVAPEHRRRGVAGKLAHAAYGLQGARGGPSLHGDGRRTDDGEAWTRALPGYGAWRVAPRSAWLPSMTPAAR